MRPTTLPVLLVLAGCPQTPTPPATAPGASAPPATTPTPWTAAQQACVDRALAALKLDAYGSPQGTMYAGGTPLFDETTGKSVTRQDYLAQHHPEVLRSCGM